MEEEDDMIASREDEGNSQHESEEEEDECRVCRGTEEEGRSLFSPCKCSGSIGLVHQDCLMSWLAVTRGEGRCELCKVKFHFAPQYAENAPDRLAVPEVLMGLARRALARWLPFVLRLAFCMSLWLVVAPLLTSYLYLIWMNRSLSCVWERWTWDLLPGDTVSGAILAAIILISFLSLMSFADFLRVEWQQQHHQQQQQQRLGPLEPDAERRIGRDFIEAAEANRRRQDEVDNEILIRYNNDRTEREAQLTEEEDQEDDNEENPDVGQGEDTDGGTTTNGYVPNENAQNPQPADGNDVPVEDVVPNNEDNNNVDNENANNDDEAQNEPIIDNAVNADAAVPDAHVEPPPQPPVEPAPRQPQRINPRQERQFDANANFDPLLQDDQVDMEINVALDELLGLRGPLSSLLRNLLWLLVFNTVYLGFFAFIPRTIGSAVFSSALNTTALDSAVDHLALLRAENEQTISLKSAFLLINQQSRNLKTVFQLPDFAAVNLGYLFCAAVVVFLRFGWLLLLKFRGNPNTTTTNNNNNTERPAVDLPGRLADPARPGAMNAAEGLDNAAGDQHIHPRLDDELDPPGLALGEAVGLILDATTAIVKVGVLLFLKMFLLPVLLGIWLDGSSTELFGSSVEERVLYAGKDLFSFILLHWVAGITFMLLVTVSVLQLREVAHADLLAHLIRPQEPQPDLLGNLMHDSVITQTKRMILSLGIYTALLLLHVSLPIFLFTSSGLSSFMPFLKLKFWHLVMPQLQVPIELLVFHLSMLALLEKYKNSIGEMQHHWLVFTSKRLGLSHCLLPHSIEKFSLLGHIPVFTNHLEVNPVLYDLVNATEEAEGEDLICSMKLRASPQKFVDGATRGNGERLLKATETYISLPVGDSLLGRGANKNDDGMVLLPTKIGRFRLKRQDDDGMETAIEVWKEVPGEPIPRPPEGWDDLGAGGADIQGRWAWGKEKQSVIERGVAHRSSFFGKRGQTKTQLLSLVARLVLLLLFSWCATTLVLVLIVSVPLGIGRLLYLILRVPDSYVHYPLGFAIGSATAFPLMAFAGSFLVSCGNTPVWQRLGGWIRSFRAPPIRKAAVVATALGCWLLICPFTLGMIYDLNFIRGSEWFSGEERVLKKSDFAWAWMTGTILLNTWACLCSQSIFTKDFWVNIGNGMLEVEGENRRDRQENAGAPQEDGEEDGSPRWQGKDGRIARFSAVLQTVLSKWEWDTVDHVVLLVECAVPVSKNLGVLLVAPALCCFLWFWSMQNLMNLGEMAGSHRLYVFRLASSSTLLVQLCITFRKQIQRWFGIVHKTARDDRYLIGEILLNYQPELES